MNFANIIIYLGFESLLTSESTDLRPVCMGSCTDFLGMIPGALSSTLCLISDLIGPWPSIGFPRASTTLPSIPSPMGTSTIDPVLLTISPSWISLFDSQLWFEEILPIVTQDDNTNIICLKIECHTFDSTAELNHLTSLYLSETKNSGNTITNRNDSTEFLKIVLNNKELNGQIFNGG